MVTGLTCLRGPSLSRQCSNFFLKDSSNDFNFSVSVSTKSRLFSFWICFSSLNQKLTSIEFKKNEFSMNFLINLILTWCLLHTFDSVLVSDVHVFAVDVIFRCPGVFLHSFWTRKYFNVNTSRSKIKNTSFIFSSSSLGSIFGFWIRIDCLNIDSRVFPKKRKKWIFKWITNHHCVAILVI